MGNSGDRFTGKERDYETGLDYFGVAARRLGRDLMIQAYNWDPDLHP